jgi:hypothetical protein
MKGNNLRLLAKLPLMVAVLLATGCSRAPSFDILGSLFPAWLFCLAVALLLTGVINWLSVRTRIPLAVTILSYPSLIALFTFGLWLAFFR